MSSALATVFLGKNETKESGILDDLHRRFPLNAKAPEIRLIDFADSSDRVRIRRALEAFKEQGVRVCGIEPSHSCADWHVRLRGNMNREGQLKRGLLIDIQEREEYPYPLDSLQQTTQMILQSLGFPTVIDFKGRVIVDNDGIHSARLAWVELGLSGAIEGWDAKEAEQWIAVNSELSDYHILEAWHSSSVELDVASEWLTQQVTYRDSADSEYPWLRAEMVDEWMRAGFTAEGATHWAKISRRMAHYNVARPWIDGGLTPKTAAKWMGLVGEGYGGGYSMVKELRSKGINADRASVLSELGFGTWEMRELVKMIDYGFSVDEVMDWARLGSRRVSINNVNAWKTLGLDAQQVKEWQNLGERIGINDMFAAVERVALWHRAGFGPEDAEPWVSLGRRFADFSTVQSWRELGLEPRDAKPWAAVSSHGRQWADLSKPENILVWQEIHSRFNNPDNIQQMIQMDIKPEQAKAVMEMLEEE